MLKSLSDFFRPLGRGLASPYLSSLLLAYLFQPWLMQSPGTLPFRWARPMGKSRPKTKSRNRQASPAPSCTREQELDRGLAVLDAIITRMKSINPSSPFLVIVDLLLPLCNTFVRSSITVILSCDIDFMTFHIGTHYH